MFTFEQITELIELVAKRHLTGLEIEKSGFRLKIEGTAVPQVLATAPVEHTYSAAAAAAPSRAGDAPPRASAAVAEAPPPATGHVIHSPIVGTFYRAPNPESPPFVEVGSRVSKGQVLCIVEAMKLMNEIQAEVSGEIVKVYVENGQPVEYGQALFGVKK